MRLDPPNRKQQVEINTSLDEFKKDIILALLSNEQFLKARSNETVASYAVEIANRIVSKL